eukprot:15351267-Ditylum_brightwellii.AAC.1
MKEFFGKFTSRKYLEECHRMNDMQLNEVLNAVVAMVAQKHKIVGVKRKKNGIAVFEKLGMEVTDEMKHFLRKGSITETGA